MPSRMSGTAQLLWVRASLIEEKNKVSLITTAGSSDLTGKSCSANQVHWAWDSWCLAHSTATSLVRTGGDKWFFVTADYAFGHAAEADATKFVTAAGGKVLGSVRYPYGSTTDFSSFLLRAQGSGANVIAFANSGSDLVTCLKQSQEFGLEAAGSAWHPWWATSPTCSAWGSRWQRACRLPRRSTGI